MLPEETRGRQELLNQIILELSEKMLEISMYEQYLNRLNALYEDNFKHQYSVFFPNILKILEEDNSYNIDYLSNNLNTLETYLEEQAAKGIAKFNNMYFQFIKLCDHLNLQISQTNYYKSMIQQSNSASKDLRDALIKLNDANNRIAEATERANTMQTELISILSIFAAIVITFSGGFTFLGSSITAISNATYYESIIMTVILCGMILFNTIFLMMYFVSKLTKRDIYVKCRKQNCSDCTKKCNILKKIRKKLPYVFYFNMIAIIGVIVDLIVWYLDIREILP